MTAVVAPKPRPLRAAAGWARLDFDWERMASVLGKAGRAWLVALPGLLTLYLSFNSGGFFGSATGVAVAVLAGTVAVRMALAKDAFAGFSRPLLLAIGALAVYSLWSLISMRWSHSPARALLDFNLTNVYLFALILVGSSARSRRRVRWTLILTWLSMLVVCVAALATRFRPDLFPVSANGETRLWFPMTYTDALGLFALCGLLLAAYLASSSREPPALRVLGTAAVPVFAVTILLTYSRAALLLAPVALIAYVLLAKPRGIVSAVLAAGPTTAFALLATYHANLISNGKTSAAAVHQGRSLTSALVIACAAAAVMRIPLLRLDRRMGQTKVSDWKRGWNRGIAVACCAAIGVLVAAGGLRGQIAHEWAAFTQQSTGFVTPDARDRVGHINVSLAERLPDWKVALKVFDSNPLRGHGAGTFGNDWNRLRPNQEVSLQTHSLYLEAMSELGIVGLVSIAVAVLALVAAGFVRAGRRASRSLWVVIGLVCLVWAIHAAAGWNWEMPAVTLPVFVLAACALARDGRSPRLRRRTETLLRVGVGLIAVGVGITASTIAVADAQLGRSVTAFNKGNCPAAAADGQASISALSSLPEPHAILGYCAISAGRGRIAVREMGQAVKRDPENWQYYYGLALADASARRDPHPAIRQAQHLNPLDPMVHNLALNLRGGNKTRWQEAARFPQMPMTLQQ